MSLGGFCWSQTEKWLDDAAVSVPAAERWGRLTAAQPLAVCDSFSFTPVWPSATVSIQFDNRLYIIIMNCHDDTKRRTFMKFHRIA